MSCFQLQSMMLIHQKINQSMRVSGYPLIFAIITALTLAFTNSELISANEITPLEMNTILAAIDAYFFNPNPTFNVEIRKFIRGAFHDCMGGCDGSINASNPANRGLENLAKSIGDAYELSTNPHNTSNYAAFKKLSRADFWVLSAQRAAAWGIYKGAQIPAFTGKPIFYYGRVSEPSGSSTDSHEGDFPGGQQNWSDMIKRFFTGIPILTQYDLVALFGFHVAGAVSLKNSGYSAPVGELNIISNIYYRNLLGYRYPDDKYVQVKAGDSWYEKSTDNTTYDKIQWVHRKDDETPAMMLPIDMMVYLKFHVNSTGGTEDGEYCPQGNNATLYNCSDANTETKKYLPVSHTAQQALNYARDNMFYLNELIPIYLKMLSYVNPSVALTPFEPKIGCVNGVPTCLGDVFFAGCGTVTTVC